jgi:hypothetical protein
MELSPIYVQPHNICCRYCKRMMLSQPVDTTLGLYFVDHGDTSEGILDSDFPISFCPNNGKRWSVVVAQPMIQEIPAVESERDKGKREMVAVLSQILRI